ncbi:hypothetical protein K3756_00040 [Sulfitobacter sp. S190]|nr:hypothetical protein K3756_00040 [Sulfitobacter sp. S190]
MFWPLVLGGLVAGIIGFAVSELDLLNRNTAGADITNQLRSDLAAQQDRLTALEEAEPPVIEPVDLSGLEEQLAALDARIVTLEERPIVTVPEGVDADAAAAYAEELSALKSSVEEQRAEIADLLNNARSVEEATAEAAKVANAQASLAKIISAIDAGQPFATELEALKTFDIGEVPDALDAAAPDGVRTLAALQAEFPDEARGALAAARSVPTDEDAQGFSGFFKRQLGVRSTRPREGTDPDAVLSRAEAAVRSGDLDEALAELETLPAPAQDTIAEWRAAADARLAARSAAADLSQRLTAD